MTAKIEEGKVASNISSLTNHWSKVLLLLAVVTFIAHFWHYQNLGLYEDDYFLIGQPMSMKMEEFPEFFQWHIVNFNVTEGRPLLYIIEFLVGFIGNLFQDFNALYLIDYGVNLLNNILICLLLKSLWNKPFFVATGTLAFALFPAETTHAYLTHINVYLSLTFLIIAFLCYFNDKKPLAYLLIFSSLFSYETVFPAFFAAPLLQKKWDRQMLWEILRHTSILAGMLAVVFIIRKATGEGRIDELDLLTLIFTPIRQMIVGPFVSLSMFFYRPAQTLLNLKGELLIFVPLFFVGFVLLFSALKNEAKDGDSDNGSGDRSSAQIFYDRENNPIFSPLNKLIVFALAVLVLAYPFNFTRAATEINGRNSRVHMTAAIGASILVGLSCYLITKLAKSELSKNLVNGGLAVFFSLLVGFGLTVQQENELAWEYQRSFWTDVIHLCPDIVPETIILVDAPLNTAKHLHSFIQWGVPITLREIYKFPEDWARIDELPKMEGKPRWFYWRKYTFFPKVYRLNPNWQEAIVNQGKLDFRPYNKAFEYFLKWEPPRLIDSHDVILLEERQGKLVRRSEPLTIGDRLFEFKPLSEPTVQSLEKGVLYDRLIQQDNEAAIDYFRV